MSKARQGHYFECMKRTRAIFKLAMRYCRSHIEQLKADACAENIFDQDSRKFWNRVYNISNSRASCHVNSVGGSSGPQEVANMWQAHFQKLYSSAIDSKYRKLFEDRINDICVSSFNPILSVYDIFSAVASQKCGKATGPDGIHMEAFIYSGHRLKICLSILFNLFILHGYVPAVFCHSTIIPIPKCKSSDLSDVNNYRAIALSNSISKILESSLLSYIESYHVVDDYQFGFVKIIQLLYALMFSKTLLAIIVRMVVMFLPVSLTSVKRLIMLITGYFLAS